MMRFVVLSCLILSVVANGGLQNFNAGKRQAGDKLIWTGTGHQMIDFAREIIMEVPFPQSDKQNNAVITQIVATTMLDAGTSQFSIQSGGVGQKNIGLKIVSDNAKKISYKIEIYGK